MELLSESTILRNESHRF